MATVRIRFAGAGEEETLELVDCLKASLGDSFDVRDAPGGSAGAALADDVLIALISGGATTLSAMVVTLGAWLTARRSQVRAATSRINITIRGVQGSSTIGADDVVHEEAVATALESAGQVIEIAIVENP